jgi:hypothetical protein
MKSYIFSILLILNRLTCVHSDILPDSNPYFVDNVDNVPQGPIYLKGTVEYAWEEDEEGFTVLPDVNRSYYYAIRDISTGDIVATALRIRQKVNNELIGYSPSILGIIRSTIPDENFIKQKCGDFCNRFAGGEDRKLRNLVSTKGTLKNLIVLFKFKDHTTRPLPSKSDINILMNHPGDGVNIAFDKFAPTGSVR